MDEIYESGVDMEEFFENMDEFFDKTKVDEEIVTEDKQDLNLDAGIGTFDIDIDEDIINALM